VRLTQGCFSFLPDLTDAQIEKQIAYAIRKGWAVLWKGGQIARLSLTAAALIIIFINSIIAAIIGSTVNQ